MANSLVQIIINATDNASRHVDEVNRSLDRLNNNGGKVTAVMTALTGSIAGMAPAVAGVGALASTFASAGVGAGAFGAVAVSSIGKVVEASEEVAKIEEKIANASTAEERIKAMQELETVMGSLSTAEKGALTSLQEFQSWWGGFTTQFDPQVFGVMAQGLDFVKNTMTALTPAITATGDVLNGFLEKLNNGFQSEQATRFFDYINTSAGANLQAVLTTAGNLFMGFFAILEAFQPLSESFNAGMVKMSEGFLNWANNLSSSTAFQNFIDYATANTPVLIDLISGLWNFIVQLVQALAPLGSVILTVVSSFAQWLATSSLVSTALGLVKQAGQFLLENLSAVKTVLAGVLVAFLAFKSIMAIISIVKVAVTVFKTLKTVFTIVRTTVLALNTAFLANPITWVIAGIVALIAIGVLLYKNWDTVKMYAQQLWDKMKQVWEGIKTSVSTMVTNIITTVTTWASNMWTKIQGMWTNIKSAFSNGVTAVVNFFKTLPTRIATIIGFMIGFVIGLIIVFATKMWQAVKIGVDKVITFFRELPSKVATFVTAMKTKAVALFKTAMSTIRSAVSTGIQAVLKFFQTLPSKVSAFVTSMKNKAVSLFKTAMSNIKSAVSTGITNVITFFRNMPSKILSIITTLKSNLVSKFQDMMNSAKEKISTGVTNMINAVKNFGSNFLSAGKGLLEAFKDGIVSGIESAKKAVSDGMEKIRKYLPFSPAKEGALSDLDKSGQSFFPTWYEGALKMVPKAERKIGGAMSTLRDALNGESDSQLDMFTGGGRTRVVHEIRGRVEVRGDNGDKVVIEQTAQQVSQDLFFKDLKQAVRKR